MSRLAIFVFLTAAPALFAQANPRIAISAPDGGVVVGETVQLQVLVRNAAGAIVANPPVTWGSNNPALIRVDSSGAATATGIGVCGVFADSGGFRATVQLQCIPLRIDLRPGQKDIAVGEQINFEAKALDNSGQPIPNVTFNWQITGANGGQINAARIDQTGLFTAVGTGVITVRARLGFGGGVPGRIEWIWGAATVRIEPKRSYRVRRLISSDEVRHSFTLRPSGQAAAINENGQAAFIGSLDGLATALLSFDRGNVSLVTQGGLPFMGGITSIVSSPSLNSRGEILTTFGIQPGTGALMLHTRNGPQYLLVTGQNFGSIENIRIDGVARGSLNDAGQAVFRAIYNLSGLPRQYTGLFRIFNRDLELLVSNETALPGLPTSNFNFEQYGIDNQGAVYFLTRANGAPDPDWQGLFRIVLSGQPERLLGGVKFPLAPPGLTVRSIRSQSFAVSKDIGVAVVADVEGRERMIRFRGSQRTEAGGAGFGNIFQVSDAAGVLFHSCGPAGCGVTRWKDDAVTQLLLLGRLAPNGEPITRIDAAALSPDGVLTAQVVTAESQFLLMRQAGAIRTSLLQAGDRLDLDAAVQFLPNNSLVRGGPDGPLHLALGSPPSLFEYDNGALIPRLILGDRIAGASVVGGSLFGTATGDCYFQVQGSVYRLRNGAVEMVIPQGMRLPDGGIIDSVIVRAANSRGALLINANVRPAGNVPFYSTNYLVEGERFTEVVRLGARLPDGRTISGLSVVYMDDNNRVVFRPQTGGADLNTHFLWTNGRLETFIADGRNQFGGVTLGTFGMRVGRGGRFFGSGTAPGGGDQGIYEHAGESWQPVVRNAERMPDGSTNYGFGAYDANSQGDIAFVTQSGSPLALNVRTVSGELRQVFSFLAPTSEGDYIRSLQELDFRDDGRIFFTAFEASGRFSVYVAEPIQ